MENLTKNTENEPQNSRATVRLPMVIAISLAAGLLMGATFFGSPARLHSLFKNYNKYKEILTLIETAYVDTVDTDTLVDYSIKKMLEKLDPHTSYYNAKEAVMARSSLQAGYDGIGVEFNVFQDSLYVVAPLAGGPSETAGIISGDIILKADSTLLAGPKLNNNLIFSSLRGPRGSEVQLTIKRKASPTLLKFTVKRDRIASFSVSAAYMMDKNTGYIKVDRFTESTMREFKTAELDLLKAGMQRMVLDLRGNPGGYMDRATDMVDEFVADEKLIVYTDGRGTTNDKKTYSGKPGSFEKGAVVVLVDEGSASASEIVAGSLQDNDRAIIVGRRSFGKGLVQRPVNLSDGSELRLTISKYYIPSGRCVQKPYIKGDEKNYEQDYSNRVKNGELYHADSIKNNKKEQYKTLKGRVVYGGGGITPDAFSPRDTSYYSPTLYKIWSKNTLRSYALDYATKNKSSLDKMPLASFVKNFRLTEKDYTNILDMAKKDGITVIAKDMLVSKEFVLLQAKAYIARNFYQKKSNENGYNNEYFQIMASNDKTLQLAMQQFDKATELAKAN
jgi:carboxyl-terminal processing protease